MKSRYSLIFVTLALLAFCLFGCSNGELATLEIVDGRVQTTAEVQSVSDDTQTESVASSGPHIEAAAVPAPETTAVPPETEVTSAETLPETTAEMSTTTKTTATQTTAAQTAAADRQTGIVYWVKNGEVWHVSSDCSSLSRSKDILSGTVSEAAEAGKERVCKRCGG